MCTCMYITQCSILAAHVLPTGLIRVNSSEYLYNTVQYIGCTCIAHWVNKNQGYVVGTYVCMYMHNTVQYIDCTCIAHWVNFCSICNKLSFTKV